MKTNCWALSWKQCSIHFEGPKSNTIGFVKLLRHKYSKDTYSDPTSCTHVAKRSNLMHLDVTHGSEIESPGLLPLYPQLTPKRFPQRPWVWMPLCATSWQDAQRALNYLKVEFKKAGCKEKKVVAKGRPSRYIKPSIDNFRRSKKGSALIRQEVKRLLVDQAKAFVKKPMLDPNEEFVRYSEHGKATQIKLTALLEKAPMFFSIYFTNIRKKIDFGHRVHKWLVEVAWCYFSVRFFWSVSKGNRFWDVFCDRTFPAPVFFFEKKKRTTWGVDCSEGRIDDPIERLSSTDCICEMCIQPAGRSCRRSDWRVWWQWIRLKFPLSIPVQDSKFQQTFDFLKKWFGWIGVHWQKQLPSLAYKDPQRTSQSREEKNVIQSWLILHLMLKVNEGNGTY